MEARDFVDVDVTPYRELLEKAGINKELADQMLAEVALRLTVTEYIQKEVKPKLEAGETVTWDEVELRIGEIAREHFGVEYGIPLPSDHDAERPMVLAHKMPFSYIPSDSQSEYFQQLTRRKIPVRNAWTRLGDREIAIVDTEEGPMVLPRYMAGERMRKMMDTMLMRSGTTQTAERELKAMETLKGKINARQWDSYVLNGAFPEPSKQSGIHYFFRKGLPTVALSFNGYKTGRVIACLCLHPMGYYFGTFCGLMVPTDEVICALLTMRADEHGFWKKSGQWSAYDIRSGL